MIKKLTAEEILEICTKICHSRAKLSTFRGLYIVPTIFSGWRVQSDTGNIDSSGKLKKPFINGEYSQSSE